MTSGLIAGNDKGRGNMEKVCEFCMALRPVVYCNADAAHLCLSCDAKVHSANALSNRHIRTLLCDSCRYHLAYIHCFDHNMYLCQNCDRSLHDGHFPHQKQAIGSYTGCPSAGDFAAPWDLVTNELTKFHEPAVSSSSGFHSTVSFDDSRKFSPPKDASPVEFKTCSANLACQMDSQLDSGDHYSTKGVNDDFEETTDQLQEMKVHFSSPFSQLERSPSPQIVGVPLTGESFWQCKSPIHNNQPWPHFMQDLGVCEEIVDSDDFNIPDVDVTFQNFEEVFGGEQDLPRGVIDDKDMSSHKSESSKLTDVLSSDQ